MTDPLTRQIQLEAVLVALQLPPDIQVRCWSEADLAPIQQLVTLQGWPTYHQTEELLVAWRNSWPALVAIQDEQVIGYVKGLTDGEVTTHIADLLVAANYRGRGIGRLLLDICHLLYPHAGINLIAEEQAEPFYRAIGFHQVGNGYYKKDR